MTMHLSAKRLEQIRDIVREASRDHGPMIVSQDAWISIVNDLLDERDELLIKALAR